MNKVKCPYCGDENIIFIDKISENYFYIECYTCKKLFKFKIDFLIEMYEEE